MSDDTTVLELARQREPDRWKAPVRGMSKKTDAEVAYDLYEENILGTTKEGEKPRATFPEFAEKIGYGKDSWAGEREQIQTFTDNIGDMMSFGLDDDLGAGMDAVYGYGSKMVRGIAGGNVDGEGSIADMYRRSYDRRKRGDKILNELNPWTALAGQVAGAVLPGAVASGVVGGAAMSAKQAANAGRSAWAAQQAASNPVAREIPARLGPIVSDMIAGAGLGATDATVRAARQGRSEDIPVDAALSGGAAALGAGVIGGGLRLAGGAGKLVKQMGGDQVEGANDLVRLARGVADSKIQKDAFGVDLAKSIRDTDNKMFTDQYLNSDVNFTEMQKRWQDAIVDPDRKWGLMRALKDAASRGDVEQGTAAAINELLEQAKHATDTLAPMERAAIEEQLKGVMGSIYDELPLESLRKIGAEFFTNNRDPRINAQYAKGILKRKASDATDNMDLRQLSRVRDKAQAEADKARTAYDELFSSQSDLADANQRYQDFLSQYGVDGMDEADQISHLRMISDSVDGEPLRSFKDLTAALNEAQERYTKAGAGRMGKIIGETEQAGEAVENAESVLDYRRAPGQASPLEIQDMWDGYVDDGTAIPRVSNTETLERPPLRGTDALMQWFYRQRGEAPGIRLRALAPHQKTEYGLNGKNLPTVSKVLRTKGMGHLKRGVGALAETAGGGDFSAVGRAAGAPIDYSVDMAKRLSTSVAKAVKAPEQTIQAIQGVNPQVAQKLAKAASNGNSLYRAAIWQMSQDPEQRGLLLSVEEGHEQGAFEQAEEFAGDIVEGAINTPGAIWDGAKWVYDTPEHISNMYKWYSGAQGK